MGFTNTGLLENTIKCYQNSNYYIYGTYGQKLTSAVVEAKIKQYPSFYRTQERINNARNAVGKYNYAYDCVGLIKSYLFGGIGNVKYNSAYDKSANGMYNAAKEKGSISSIPSIKGLLVWMNGHIGVYDGKKYTYECTVSGGSYKIIKTVAKTRGWTNWCKCPYITYETASTTTTTNTTSSKKTNEELAEEVIAGKWGNGDARKTSLKNAGYDYDAIQKIVNQKMSGKTTASTTKTKKVVAKAGLIIRKSPTTDSVRLTAVSYGATVTVISENVASANGFNWDKVTYNNVTGYMANKYLS